MAISADRTLALRVLREIARDKEVEPEVRLRAAETLLMAPIG